MMLSLVVSSDLDSTLAIALRMICEEEIDHCFDPSADSSRIQTSFLRGTALCRFGTKYTIQIYRVSNLSLVHVCFKRKRSTYYDASSFLFSQCFHHNTIYIPQLDLVLTFELGIKGHSTHDHHQQYHILDIKTIRSPQIWPTTTKS